MITSRSIFLVFLLTPILAFSQYSGSGSVSQGSATIVSTNIYAGCAGSRVSGVGTIISTDGKSWTVPSATQFLSGSYLPDLYNQCNGVIPSSISAVNLATVPVTTIDASGSIITAYLFGDNYFELYINGILVGVDPVPFTPFNSCVVKFKVSYPYTIALKLVDWEENLGLGTELNSANPYHSGDGGFIASFSDGTITNGSWKAQTYYIAPVQNLNTIIELSDSTRSSATAVTSTSCNVNCYAIHYTLPSGWQTTSFNDTHWPNASLYSPTTVGVSSISAYSNFPSIWSTAQFIWSSNLILDNEVLLRKTVTSPTAVIDNNFIHSDVEIFPNPTSDQFQLNFNKTNSNDQIKKISIYNLLGEKIFETTQYKDNIVFGNIRSGIYSLIISFENYQITKKLIIQ